MLNRLMLRLAVVNALSPQPGEPAPTIANTAVFDSRLDDLEFDGNSVELPIILVYTEDDEYVLQDRGSPGTSERHVNIRIEIALGSFSASVEDGVKHITYGLPTTDAELEALLDFFEAQVYRTIMHPTRAASTALQAMVIQWDTWHSSAQRSSDANNRLAARTIAIKVRLPPDCRPQVTQTPLVRSDKVPHFSEAPYLNPLITVLAKNPANASLMDMLREAAGGGPQVYVPPFQRMGVKVDCVKPADPNLLAILGRTMGPDGRLDVQAEWTVRCDPVVREGPLPLTPVYLSAGGLWTNGTLTLTAPDWHNLPTSPVGLGVNAFWSNNGEVCLSPGSTILPFYPWGLLFGGLWNNGEVVCFGPGPTGLPGSSAGLPSGSRWSNGGVLTIA